MSQHSKRKTITDMLIGALVGIPLGIICLLLIPAWALLLGGFGYPFLCILMAGAPEVEEKDMYKVYFGLWFLGTCSVVWTPVSLVLLIYIALSK